MEVTQATGLCCQKFVRVSTGEDERIATMNKGRAQRIRNIMVAHIHHYHDKQLKPNKTRKERKLVKDLLDGN